MQQQVWKFTLPFLKPSAAFVDVEMPIDAKLLTCQVQHGEVCIWAQVSPGAPKSKRRFMVYGTGHPIDDYIVHNYIGTVQLAGGTLVLHVFEVFPR